MIGKYLTSEIFTIVSESLIFDHTSYLRQVAVGLSPNLGEEEMRIVLSWETTQDLDIYALQMDK